MISFFHLSFASLAVSELEILPLRFNDDSSRYPPESEKRWNHIKQHKNRVKTAPSHIHSTLIFHLLLDVGMHIVIRPKDIPNVLLSLLPSAPTTRKNARTYDMLNTPANMRDVPCLNKSYCSGLTMLRPRSHNDMLVKGSRELLLLLLIE